MGNNIHWYYRNKLENVQTITESSGTTNTNYGSANVIDFDLNTSFRSDTPVGTTSLLFDFGSSIYVDSAIAITNIPGSGTFILQAGTTSTVGDFSTSLPNTVGTVLKAFSAQSYRYWQLRMDGGNLVINGEFTDASSWIAGASASLASIAGGKSGNCLRITENGADNPYAYQSIFVTAGGSYEFITYVKAGTEASYNVVIYDLSNLATIETTGTLEETAGDWSTEVKISFQAPEGCTIVRILLYQIALNGSATTLLYDSVIVQQIRNSSNIYHEVFELFLGSRNEFSENPIYPVLQPIKDDVVASETASGQRHVFHNFSRQSWEFNYKTITNSTQQDISKMQAYCKGSSKPLWFSMDPTNTPHDVTFIRLASKSFKYKETIADVWDVKFKVDEEL